MRDGFVKCAAMIPSIKVADCANNEAEIIRLIDEAATSGAKVVVFPELCITGYTCGDLFLQDSLLNGAIASLIRIAKHSEGLDMIAFVGLPFMYGNKLYNAAAAVSGGRILGITPKTHLPNYSEFYEVRHFNPAPTDVSMIKIGGLDYEIPFGSHIL